MLIKIALTKIWHCVTHLTTKLVMSFQSVSMAPLFTSEYFKYHSSSVISNQNLPLAPGRRSAEFSAWSVKEKVGYKYSDTYPDTIQNFSLSNTGPARWGLPAQLRTLSPTICRLRHSHLPLTYPGTSTTTTCAPNFLSAWIRCLLPELFQSSSSFSESC